MSLKDAYSIALGAEPGRLHFAAHSHHLWPDCTREAQLQAWTDAATMADEKWEPVFKNVVGKTKGYLGKLLGVESGQICLAPNTHEFVFRLFSCFPQKKPLRVLTTDSEFHSFSRQLTRLEEEGAVIAERVAVEPFASFIDRWQVAAKKHDWDLVFISQVFFNSGLGFADLTQIIEPVESAAAIVVDGYHAFCALPIHLGELGEKIFYMGGSYKYAQSGEGLCFLSVAKHCDLRPVYTGWFAAYSALEKSTAPSVTAYDSGGMRFAGATMDFSAAYRFNAVQDWWQSIGLDVTQIHKRVTALKNQFVSGLESGASSLLKSDWILREPSGLPVGHFTVLRTPRAAEIGSILRERRVIVDWRGDRLRFGFGLYHDRSTVDALLERIA